MPKGPAARRIEEPRAKRRTPAKRQKAGGRGPQPFDNPLKREQKKEEAEERALEPRAVGESGGGPSEARS